MKSHTIPKRTQVRRVAFLAALVSFAAVNLALYCFHNFYQPPIAAAVLNSQLTASCHFKEWSWWLARTWLEQKKAPDVVLFGSSQMGSAVCAADAQHNFQLIDALTHRRANTFESELNDKFHRQFTVFNLASPGAMCSDAFMASKALFSNDLQPKLVVIGIAPRDFIDNSMPYAAATEPYKFYSRYVSPGKLLTSAYHDTLSWLQFGLDAMPCRRFGVYMQELSSENAPAKKAETEKSRNALAAVLGGSEAEPGKWLVPANIPANIWADNTKEYKHRFQNPNTPIYEAERNFFKEFLANMQSRNITVIVVGMPSLPMNRELLSYKFWNKFRSSIATSCALHKAQFLDLTDSRLFVKADYLDTVHLNAKGGAKLFKILAQYAACDQVVAARFNCDAPAQPAKDRMQTASTDAASVR